MIGGEKKYVVRDLFRLITVFFVVFSLFSNDNLWFRINFGDGLRQGIVATTLVSVMGYYLLYSLYSKRIAIFDESEAAIYSSVVALGVYMFVHDLVFIDGYVSIKYALFMCFLFLLMINVDRVDIVLWGKGFVVLVATLSIFVIAQFFLLSILNNGSVDSFEQIHQSVTFRGNKWFVNPYGLGYIEESNRIYIGDNFEFRRFNSYISESKYFGMILLLSISILLSFYRNTKVRNILLSIHFFALLLAASATTIFVGIISFLLYLFRHKLTPLLVVAVMFAGTSFFSIVVLELLYIYLPEGFLQNRISSALASTFNYSAVFSPFGESRNLKEYGRGNFLQTYGVLGFLLLQIFLYCFWVKIFYVIRCGSKVVGNNRVEFAMLLIMACFYVYPLTVFNDLFTLLNVLSFLLIYSIYNSYRKNICYKIRYSMVKG